jgi:hypothetical protein
MGRRTYIKTKTYIKKMIMDKAREMKNDFIFIFPKIILVKMKGETITKK